MAEETSYDFDGMREAVSRVTHTAEQPAKRAEDLVMDAARYQDARKWGDADLAVTRDFGALYETRLMDLENDIHTLVREIAEFSDAVRQAAFEAGILDEMVAAQWERADRKIAGSSVQHTVTPKSIRWEG